MNTKLDGLSLQIIPEEPPSSPTTICLPVQCVLGQVRWDIEYRIQEVLRSQPDPGTGPLDRLFVPDSVQSLVLHWGHASQIACHPFQSFSERK